MQSLGSLIFFIVLIVIGLVLFVWGFLSFRWKRLIQNIPTSKIRSIAMGLVEISGIVVPKENKILKSPFSQNDCVYYRCMVEEYRRSGKHSHWVTVFRDEMFNLFYLKDDTGMVIIDPRNAKIDIPMDNCFRSSFGNDPPESVKKFLNSSNVSFEGFLFGVNKTMKYTEWFISPGDKLYILGTASDNPYFKEASAEKGVEDVMIHKGENEKFYYISDRGERSLLRRFSLKAYSGIIIGSFLIALSLIVALIL